MKLDYAVGFAIRKIRRDQMLIAGHVAERVPMSRAYLCEVERGGKLPSLPMLADIANALDLTTAELFREIADVLDGR